MPSMQAIRFAILIILLTRFSAIFFMSQFRYRTGICRWKTCRTSLTCLASMSLEVDFFTSFTDSLCCRKIGCTEDLIPLWLPGIVPTGIGMDDLANMECFAEKL